MPEILSNYVLQIQGKGSPDFFKLLQKLDKGSRDSFKLLQKQSKGFRDSLELLQQQNTRDARASFKLLQI